MLAAELGFDGLGLNEHHQNPYGFMCNPNLFGAILARLTRERGFDDVALVQLGATIAATTPPIRIAEEYAVLDCLSGGRLVAGVPVGIGADANISYGITPIEQRQRWREALELMLQGLDGEGDLRVERRATTSCEGEPVAAAGAGSAPAAARARGAELVDVGLVPRARLPVRLPQLLRRQVRRVVMDGFWERADAKGRDANPTAPRSCSSSASPRPTSGRGRVRHARRVLLQEAPAHPAAVLRAARLQRVQEPPPSVQPDMFEYQDFTVDLKQLTARDMIDEGVRRRRQPGDRPGPARGHRAAPQRRPPDGRAPVRLDAA